MNPVELRKGIQKSVNKICEEIDRMSDKIDLRANKDKALKAIRNVALVSSNGDKEIADAITDVHARVGGKSTISIQEGHG